MSQKITIFLLTFLLFGLLACEKVESYETTIETQEQTTNPPPTTSTAIKTTPSSLTKNPPCVPDYIPYFISLDQTTLEDEISLLINFNYNKNYNGDCSTILGVSQDIAESYGTFSDESTAAEISNMNLSIPITLTDWASDISFTVDYSDCNSWVCDLCLEMDVASTFSESNSIILTCGNEVACFKSGTLSLILPVQPGDNVPD